jgi:hypothetical protein
MTPSLYMAIHTPYHSRQISIACIAEQEKKNFNNNSEEKIREKELGGVV